MGMAVVWNHWFWVTVAAAVGEALLELQQPNNTGHIQQLKVPGVSGIAGFTGVIGEGVSSQETCRA